MELTADALQSTINEIFTSLKFEDEGESAQKGAGGDDGSSDSDEGEHAEKKHEKSEEGDAEGSKDGSEETHNKQGRKQWVKKIQDPSYRSVTPVVTGECSLSIDFHGDIPAPLENIRYRKLRATFSFVPSIDDKEGTLVVMKAINNEPQTDIEDKSKKTKDTEFPAKMEYLVRKQPGDYPKLYMEPLTDIEIGVLMNYPREAYYPVSITVGWLHWKSGRFRAQDPHNHIPIKGLDGSTVDVRDVYREVTRQFSAYCQNQRIRTISFRSDQEVFFALGFFSDSNDPKNFIRRLVDGSGSILTFYQFLMLHDSVKPGRKRLYVWTATRRKGQRKVQNAAK